MPLLYNATFSLLIEGCLCSTTQRSCCSPNSASALQRIMPVAHRRVSDVQRVILVAHRMVPVLYNLIFSLLTEGCLCSKTQHSRCSPKGVSALQRILLVAHRMVLCCTTQHGRCSPKDALAVQRNILLAHRMVPMLYNATFSLLTEGCLCSTTHPARCSPKGASALLLLLLLLLFIYLYGARTPKGSEAPTSSLVTIGSVK